MINPKETMIKKFSRWKNWALGFLTSLGVIKRRAILAYSGDHLTSST